MWPKPSQQGKLSRQPLGENSELQNKTNTAANTLGTRPPLSKAASTLQASTKPAPPKWNAYTRNAGALADPAPSWKHSTATTTNSTSNRPVVTTTTTKAKGRPHSSLDRSGNKENSSSSSNTLSNSNVQQQRRGPLQAKGGALCKPGQAPAAACGPPTAFNNNVTVRHKGGQASSKPSAGVSFRVQTMVAMLLVTTRPLFLAQTWYGIMVHGGRPAR